MGTREGTYSVREDSRVDVDVVFTVAMMAPDVEDVVSIVKSR